ncbi:hypothetical protein BX600DRAFT_68416 [Xylariales sp. PMI_506]|nr:hypothetical protein BX600DRAFT_68416 [Xylariales sp. PMI_506]
MASATAHIEFLLNSPLPEGAPKLKPDEGKNVEVYGLGDLRAVVIVNATTRGTSVHHHWSSTQDAEFGAQVLSIIQHRYLKPEKRLVIHVAGAHKGLFSQLNHIPPAAEILAKCIDHGVTLPHDISYRAMQEDEAGSFFEGARENMARQALANRPDLSLTQAQEMAKTNFARAAPQGVDTPGHAFMVVETTQDGGGKVANIWAVFDEETKESFCYYVEVVPELRKMGYGRKTLTAWEHHGAQIGAQSLALNIFGINTPLRSLCSGAGFVVREAAFVIQQ